MSPRTVSRVLRSESRDTRPTIVRRAQRIRELADRLHYRPNAAARAISTGRCGAVALLRESRVPSLRATLVQAGVVATLPEHDLHLVVEGLPNPALNGSPASKILRQVLVDGLLVHAAAAEEETRGLLASLRAPLVWVDADVPHDGVAADDSGAAGLATRHLLERGHRRIVYIDFVGDAVGVLGAPRELRERRAGYESAMREVGLMPQVQPAPALATPAERLAYAERWLREGARPTAILASDRSALAPVLFAARGLGIRTPEALSFAAIDDAVTDEWGLRVTTVVRPNQAIGCAAVAMLLQKLADRTEPAPARAMPFTLEAGATVATRPAV